MIRPTKESVAERRNEIAQLRTMIERANKLSGAKETEWWKILRHTLEYSIKSNSEQYQHILDRKTAEVGADFANMKAFRAAELTSKRILDDVERGEEMIDLWLRRIKTLEEEIAKFDQSGALI